MNLQCEECNEEILGLKAAIEHVQATTHLVTGQADNGEIVITVSLEILRED